LRGASAFLGRLRELGWIEGRNLVIESRWADGQVDRLPAVMAEVVARKVDVLVTYATPGAVAARNATSTIPIVVATMGDPIAIGLAASLAHPGGNLTGLSHG
jgi:putative ABC transport system substrate-binding protein